MACAPVLVVEAAAAASGVVALEVRRVDANVAEGIDCKTLACLRTLGLGLGFQSG